MTAPQFTATAVVNGAFKEVSLADYKGNYVVLIFFPQAGGPATINK